MNKHKVLVVDDDPLNVKLLSAMLPSEQYEKISAYGGEAALASVMEKAPDLILLDVMMPGVDGFEVTERIRSNDDTRDIPIILVTALDGIDNKIKGLECGADEFINKPVNSHELTARVESLIKLKNYQEQLKISSEQKRKNHFQSNTFKQLPSALGLPTILIVEDNEKDVKLIKSFLHGEPYQLKNVKTGEEAINVTLEEKIDVILLDMLLPGLDGFKVCKIIKESEVTKNIQIVVVTSLMDLESKIRGINLGADDFLVKPINRYELKIRAKALIKKKAYLDSLCNNSYGQSLFKVIMDHKTGLLSNVYFNYCFEQEIKRSIRQNLNMCYLQINFQGDAQKGIESNTLTQLNDLKQMGEIVRSNIREIDIATHLGGNDFGILMSNTQGINAKIVGERIKQVIENKPNLKTRYGISECPKDSEALEELVLMAESHLNRVAE